MPDTDGSARMLPGAQGFSLKRAAGRMQSNSGASIITRSTVMSIAEIERFAADLRSNQALHAEAAKAQAETPVVAFAASKGYAFTADEVKEYAKTKQLTDAELDSVAGGGDRPANAGLGPRDGVVLEGEWNPFWTHTPGI
jgi:predicted ribosomally synthesized peptide with nif11-like leader